MPKSKYLPILASAAALGTLALTGPSAHADFMASAFDLNFANPDLATQGSGPYASIQITGIGSGTTASDTFQEFHVTATGLNSFVFGDHSIVGLNLSTSAGAGTLCQTNGGLCTTGAPSITLSQTSGQVDGFGNFDFVLDDGSGFSSPHSSFSFDFTTATAVTEASLLTGTSTGATAVAHMALSTNTACTGFAGNAASNDTSTAGSSCTAVPAPIIGHGIFVLLSIGGVLLGGKFLEDLKKRHFQAA